MHDLRLLSPLDFELLVRDLLQEEFGILLESFGPGRDSGIDFRFAQGTDATIVQVKHYLDSGHRKLVAAAKKELPKVKKLQLTRYIFATSLPLSPNQKSELIEAMPGVPLQAADIISREDIDNLLTRHPKVLRQHLKLWLTNTQTLERIVHAGIYNRNQPSSALGNPLRAAPQRGQSAPAAGTVLLPLHDVDRRFGGFIR